MLRCKSNANIYHRTLADVSFRVHSFPCIQFAALLDGLQDDSTDTGASSASASAPSNSLFAFSHVHVHGGDNDNDKNDDEEGEQEQMCSQEEIQQQEDYSAAEGDEENSSQVEGTVLPAQAAPVIRSLSDHFSTTPLPSTFAASIAAALRTPSESHSLQQHTPQRTHSSQQFTRHMTQPLTAAAVDSSSARSAPKAVLGASSAGSQRNFTIPRAEPFGARQTQKMNIQSDVEGDAMRCAISGFKIR
jgi:hypothetical protein